MLRVGIVFPFAGDFRDVERALKSALVLVQSETKDCVFLKRSETNIGTFEVATESAEALGLIETNLRSRFGRRFVIRRYAQGAV
ncbi:hypothetical protein [Hyphobacterium sp.]|uniref:hypothetical protein n=1 Tax=Hyphobacterium sp. TaxID=2004662 RepID=UPI0037497CA9